MTAVLLALAASLTWGFADFGAGLAARRTTAYVAAAGAQLSGLVLVAIVVAATGEAFPSARQAAWAVFAGVAAVVGLSAFYRALAIGTMGIVGPITATGAMVPLVFGLARGEQPDALQGVGVALHRSSVCRKGGASAAASGWRVWRRFPSAGRSSA